MRTNTKRNQKEAMLMMKKSMAHLLERVMQRKIFETLSNEKLFFLGKVGSE